MNEFNPFGSTLQTVLWFTNEGLNLLGWAFGIPWLGLVAKFLEEFGMWLAEFFSGRPAVGPDSATDDVALLLIASPNPVVSMWGMGIRSLEAQGIPLSTSDPAGQAKYEKLAAAVLADLQAQFGSNPGQEAFNLYAQASAMHDPDSNPNALALRNETDSLYTKAVQNGTLDPKTALPPTQPVTNPLQPPPPPPPPPGGDPDQDEFQDCCDETQTALANILSAIKDMPQGTDQTCCANIVSAIVKVADAVAGVAAHIPSPTEPSTPPDLTPLVNALLSLVTAVSAYAPLLETIATRFLFEFGQLLRDIVPGLGLPLESIARSTATAAAQGDVPQSIIDQMVKEGAVSPQLGQLLQGAPWAHVISAVLGAMGTYLGGYYGSVEWGLGKLLVNVLEPLGKEIWALIIAAFPRFLAAFKEYAGDAGPAFANAITSFAPTLETAAGAPAIEALDFVLGPAKSLHNVNPGEQDAAAEKTFARAWVLGLVSHVLAMLSGIVPLGLSNAFEGMAAQVSKAAGWDEIVHSIHAPWYASVFGIPARYEALGSARPIIPQFERALELYARRIITAAQRDELLKWNGFHPDWAGAMTQIAYRPLSPFMLAAGFQDADINIPVLRNALEYMGTRPSDVPLAIQAIETRSLSNVRNQYIAEAMSAYAAGVVGDAELDEIFADAGWGKAASALARKRALIARRVTLAKEVEGQVVPLVAAGAISPDEGTHQLSAAGVQPWQVNLKIELATTKALIARAKAAASAERKLELARQRKSADLAILNFRNGSTDAAGLAVELLAAGLDPAIVATTVAAQEAIRAGRLKLVFGQLLSPQKAKILTEQVAAVESQLKKQLISDQQALSNLEVLNVDAPERQALLSRWMAEKAAATKTGEFLTP